MMIFAATSIAFLFLLGALSLGAVLDRGRQRPVRRIKGCGAPDCCSAPNNRHRQ